MSLQGLELALQLGGLGELRLLGLLEDDERLLRGLHGGDQVSELVAHRGRTVQLVDELADVPAVHQARDNARPAARVDGDHELGELDTVAVKALGVRLDPLRGRGQGGVELDDLALDGVQIRLRLAHPRLHGGHLGADGGLLALQALELAADAVVLRLQGGDLLVVRIGEPDVQPPAGDRRDQRDHAEQEEREGESSEKWCSQGHLLGPVARLRA